MSPSSSTSATASASIPAPTSTWSGRSSVCRCMDLDRIERLVRLFGRSHARELQVESKGWSLSLSRANTPVAAGVAPPGEPLAAAAADERVQDSGRVTVTAPLVGIFRQGGVRLQPGDRVEAGAPL